MSILMDALKQQTAPQPVVSESRFWRNLALTALFLLTLLTGFVAGYYVVSQQPVSLSTVASHNTIEQIEPAPPASASDIITALSLPQPAETVPKAEPERLPLPEPVVMVTVPSEPEPVLPEPVIREEAPVSDELRNKFELALKATESTATEQPSIRTHHAPARDIHLLDEQLKRQIPALRFDAHVYATEPAQRWIKVNGKTLQEGQWATADIRIREITPQYVLMEMGTQLFSMSALSEWSYR